MNMSSMPCFSTTYILIVIDISDTAEFQRNQKHGCYNMKIITIIINIYIALFFELTRSVETREYLRMGEWVIDDPPLLSATK